MALRSLLFAGLATSASAIKLLVAGYGPGDGTNGTVTTFEFTPGLADYGANESSATLTKVAANTECNSAPTWLDLSLGGGKVVCLDEGFSTPNATIVTLTAAADGSLKAVHSVSTIQGPVSTKFYNNNTAVALAHYGGSAISTFKVSADGAYTPLERFSFLTRNDTGPRPEQEASHVHEAISDPTGQFLIFPDLGLDTVHVYSINPTSGLLTNQKGIKSPSGYGPRHAAFWKSGSDTYLFVIHELANRIISYKTTYNGTGLSFSAVDEVGLYGNQTDPVGTRAAEIIVSPDNKFVIASNRNATIANVPNPDPSNSTQLPSDSLVTLKPSSNGKLSFVQLVPSGGKFPRHFSTNKDGSLVAVANQNTLNVDVYAREPATGMIGSKVASAFGLPGSGLTNVIFLEDGF